MKTIFFLLILIAGIASQAQTTISLDARVQLLQNDGFKTKVRAAVNAVAVGILTTSQPEDSTAAAALLLKKQFAMAITQGKNVDNYIQVIISTGRVTPLTPDNVLLGLVSVMFDNFVAVKQGQ